MCQQQGITVADLSYDVIAEAFIRDGDNRYRQLQNFVSSLRESLENVHETEVFLAYKSFIMSVANVQLARLYAQTDPFGAKIHRNIRDCLKHSTLFETTKDFRGYVLQPLETDALDHLERFPVEDLERQFLSVARANQTTHELIEHLHSTVVNQTHYRRSILLIEVVYLFKKIFVNELESIFDETGQPPVGELSDFEIENIRNQVEITIKEKILLTYFARGKIDRRQAEAIANAFHDMLVDWCSSGDSDTPLHEYLQRYLPIDNKTYEHDFRSKMEYLLKIARDEFAARLMKDI